MMLAGFIAAHLHTIVDAPGGVGGQCVDLTNVWLAEVRALRPLRLNAKDWATVAVFGHVWTPNTAVNFPSPGDIVVWHPYPPYGIGVFGHIAICVAADAAHLITIDQDWPLNAPTGIVVHTYAGVAGWHHATSFSGGEVK